VTLLPKNVESLNRELRTIAEGLSAIVERLQLPLLDLASSSVVGDDDDGLHATLTHARRPELGVEVIADGHGEIVVSFGYEHEHFRSDDAMAGRVWPFQGADHVQATLTFVEGLLTGRVELQVWKRPFSVKVRSFWTGEDGRAELFLRSSTVLPVLGWSRTPETYRFDFTKQSASI
jgi:hypothetical protein